MEPNERVKVFEIGLRIIRKHFQAFIFRSKKGSKRNMPSEWELQSFDNNEFIKKMVAIEFSPFDIMDQA